MFHFVCKSKESHGFSISVFVSFAIFILLTVSNAWANLSLASDSPDEVILSWIAPGDDGNEGTAAQYDIRYSTSGITESNWGSATQVDGETAPKSSGSDESFTVSNLNSGTLYYFAIKTADEVPNWSALSNVASITTSLVPPDILYTNLNTTKDTVTLSCNQVSASISIYYQFALDTLDSFDSARYQTGSLSGSDIQTTYAVNTQATYYWHCRVIASDHSDTSAWSDSLIFNNIPAIIFAISIYFD